MALEYRGPAGGKKETNWEKRWAQLQARTPPQAKMPKWLNRWAVGVPGGMSQAQRANTAQTLQRMYQRRVAAAHQMQNPYSGPYDTYLQRQQPQGTGGAVFVPLDPDPYRTWMERTKYPTVQGPAQQPAGYYGSGYGGAGGGGGVRRSTGGGYTGFAGRSQPRRAGFTPQANIPRWLQTMTQWRISG